MGDNPYLLITASMSAHAENTKRVAKNTLLLYMRTILVLMISLYISRLVLEALGVEDFGVYNVVGGVVALFGSVSGALSGAISRYITVEIGRNDFAQLCKVFRSSCRIQLYLSGLILFFGEIAGVVFLNNFMNIPEGRLVAANIVLQFSLLSFIIGLLGVPYRAAVIAHEKMSAFAYISIFEVLLKLAVACSLFFLYVDLLAVYAFLLAVVAVLTNVVYVLYCKRNFKETCVKGREDRTLIKEMLGFSGWSLISNCAYILNTQGVNVLINIYFGVSMNAARGIALQVESAVMKFVNDFTTALNPQIMKKYASGEMSTMYTMVCLGAKYSYFLLLLLSLPLLFEAPLVLKIWLKVVPDYSVLFFRLSLVATAFSLLGNSGYIGCVATGNMKYYVKSTVWLGLLTFPIAWVAFALGGECLWAYLSAIIVNFSMLLYRLLIMKKMIGFPPKLYFVEVLARIVPVTLLSIIPALYVYLNYEDGYARLFALASLSLVSVLGTVFVLGLKSDEKKFVLNFVKEKIRKLKK